MHDHAINYFSRAIALGCLSWGAWMLAHGEFAGVLFSVPFYIFNTLAAEFTSRTRN